MLSVMVITYESGDCDMGNADFGLFMVKYH